MPVCQPLQRKTPLAESSQFFVLSFLRSISSANIGPKWDWSTPVENHSTHSGQYHPAGIRSSSSLRSSPSGRGPERSLQFRRTTAKIQHSGTDRRSKFPYRGTSLEAARQFPKRSFLHILIRPRPPLRTFCGRLPETPAAVLTALFSLADNLVLPLAPL